MIISGKTDTLIRRRNEILLPVLNAGTHDDHIIQDYPDRSLYNRKSPVGVQSAVADYSPDSPHQLPETRHVYKSAKIPAGGFSDFAAEVKEYTLILLACEDESPDSGYLNHRVILAER